MTTAPELASDLIARADRAAKAFGDRSVVVVTLDIDWASEACIADVLDMLEGRNIRPTCFATHESAELRRRIENGSINVGLHPNFLPGSSHGTGERAVFDHIKSRYPEAVGFRSHSFADSSRVSSAALGAGMIYDSNACAFLSSRIVPIWHWLGFWRFPVFWEDDVHWTALANWSVGPVAAALATPGLKVINLHPFNQALNIPGPEFYEASKTATKTIDAAAIARQRHRGAGCRTFVEALIDAARTARLEFTTMESLVASLDE